MKNAILITLFAILLLSSCRRDLNRAVDLNGHSTTTQYTLDKTLPENLCGLITVEMIMDNFDVQKLDLDLEDDYSKCGYSWKKNNFEQLRDQQIEAVFDYAKRESGLTSKKGADTELSKVVNIESPYNTVQVGNFKKYKNLQEAVDQFTKYHQVPDKEEMNRLYNEMKKQIAKENAKNGLDANEIEEKLKFTYAKTLDFQTIDGVGDQAFYDYLDKSLDVRYGIISFKVYLDSEKDFETSIEIAKDLANAVWDKL